jgi:DNA primase
MLECLYEASGLSEVYKYLNLRKFDVEEVVERFKLYPYLDPEGLLRIGIPAYDEYGNLVGVNARRMDGVREYPDKAPKYRIESGYKKGLVLYNLNNARHYSKREGLILVEGEFSAIRLLTYGYNNVVCSMGSVLSDQQLALIYKHAFELTFLMENDDAAEDGVKRTLKKIKNGLPLKVNIACLPEGDADSCPKIKTIEALENRKLLTKEQLTWLTKDV